MRCDVLVVGSGLAGIVAACKADKQGAKVILLDRGGIGLGNNTTMSQAHFTAPTKDYPVSDFINDTISLGKGLNHKKRVEFTGKNAEQAFLWTQRNLGVSFESGPSFYRFPYSKPDRINGLCMMQSILKTFDENKNIIRLPGRKVLELEIRGGKVIGVKALSTAHGLEIIRTKSVILACGGFGAIYKHNDNMRKSLGQGYLLAAQAGLDLWDMEFVQFYPLILAEKGLPMVLIYPPYPKGAKLLNKDNQDLLALHNMADFRVSAKTQRDAFSALIYKESLKGPVRMDISHLDLDWSKYPLAWLNKMKFDFKNKPFTVMPGAHFCMGGLKTELTGETEISGLFVCGEMLWGLHGANRRGGNALTECLVTGIAAGEHSAKFAKENPLEQSHIKHELPGYLREEQKGSETARQIINMVRQTAWNKAGILRNQNDLSTGRELAEKLMQKANGLPISDNKAVLEKQDAISACFTLKAVLTASLQRKESRGAFQRTDLPKGKDPISPQNSKHTYESIFSDPETSFKPVA